MLKHKPTSKNDKQRKHTATTKIKAKTKTKTRAKHHLAKRSMTTATTPPISGVVTNPAFAARRAEFQAKAQTDAQSIKPASIGLNGVDYPPFVFVLGGPGSGKGTQCEKLIEACESGKFPHLPQKIFHVNVGGVLRNAQGVYRDQKATNTLTEGMAKAGPVLDEMLSTGAILPSWVTVTLMREELNKIQSTIINDKLNAGVIIDGFPRSLENLQAFEDLIAIPSRLLLVDVPPAVMTDRVLKRALHSGREDDNVETIKKRINVFNSDTAAVLTQYCLQDSAEKALEFNKTHGVMRLGVKIDGDRPVEDISKDFIAAYAKLSGTAFY